jgi:hypothetical protein
MSATWQTNGRAFPKIPIPMFPNDDFVYRTNADGTRDSICVKCFATVATCSSDVELVKGERIHVCYVTKTYREFPPVAV